MTSELVQQLIAANEGDKAAQSGDIFYRAAERIAYLERQLESKDEQITDLQERNHALNVELTV